MRISNSTVSIFTISSTSESVTGVSVSIHNQYPHQRIPPKSISISVAASISITDGHTFKVGISNQKELLVTSFFPMRRNHQDGFRSCLQLLSDGLVLHVREDVLRDTSNIHMIIHHTSNIIHSTNTAPTYTQPTYMFRNTYVY